MAFVLLVIGFVLLSFGADWLVKGSASLALRLKVSSLVIGLTVVAYGTSMPEMVVSAQTAWQGKGDIALGNVIGSNICNIALILGLTALICPLQVHTKMIRIDAPIMVAFSALFLFFFSDKHISRIEGGIFVAMAILYTVASYVGAMKTGTPQDEEEFKPEGLKTVWHEIGYILLGFGLLVGGAQLLITGAVEIAEWAGMSKAVIGLTIVALGTSLPELATSVVAALKKESDIALGNIIGSNIFNIVGILGVAGLVKPLEGVGISWIDMGVMIGVAVLLTPMLLTGKRLSRLEGGILLSIYIGYIAYLLIQTGAAARVTA